MSDLLLNKLLPRAAEGLDRWGVSPVIRDRLLGVVEGRCITGRNGATWQTDTVTALEAKGMNRAEALRRMLRLYRSRMQANEPVHTWPVP